MSEEHKIRNLRTEMEFAIISFSFACWLSTQYRNFGDGESLNIALYWQPTRRLERRVRKVDHSNLSADSIMKNRKYSWVIIILRELWTPFIDDIFVTISQFAFLFKSSLLVFSNLSQITSRGNLLLVFSRNKQLTLTLISIACAISCSFPY